jgi:uncharacterized membrane protein (DUF2068 family)
MLLISIMVLAVYVAVVSGSIDESVITLNTGNPLLPSLEISPTTTAQADSDSVAQMFDMSFPELVQLVVEIVMSVLIIYGLWGMHRWAWYIVMLSLGVSMSADLYSYFFDQPNYWTMLFSVMTVFYLNQREVQQAFARKKPESTAALVTR